MELFNPQVDFVFKRIFGTEENQDILVSFLNAVFEDSGQPLVSQVEVLNPFLEKDALTDKMSVLDIKARTETGTLINIEIQLRDAHDMAHRSLYYWAKLFEEQLQQGQYYHTLHKTVTINVLSFAMIPGLAFHTTFHLREDHSDYLLTDLAEMHFIELPKLRDQKVGLERRLVRWMLFLTATTPDRLEALAMSDPVLKKAVNTLEFLSQDARERALYEDRRKALLDWNSSIRSAKEEGREEGERHRALATARNLVSMGLSVQQIAQATGLSPAEVEQIRQQPE